MTMIDYTLGTWDANTSLGSSISTNAVSSVDASTIVDLGASGTDGWGTAKANQFGGDLRMNVNMQTGSLAATCVLMIELCTLSTVSSFASNAKAIAAVAIPYVDASNLGIRASIGVPSNKLLRYVAPRGRAITAKCTSATIDVWLGFGEETSQDEF